MSQMSTKNVPNRQYQRFCWFLSLFVLFSLVNMGQFSLAQDNPGSTQQTRSTESYGLEVQLAGSVEAKRLFERAKSYHDGIGVPKDYAKARKLYLQAEALGDNDARINLGYLYFMGQGVTQNYTEARKWYEKAAQNGSKEARTNLAMIYTHGLGVPKDLGKAKYWENYKVRIDKKFETQKPAAPILTTSDNIANTQSQEPLAQTKLRGNTPNTTPSNNLNKTSELAVIKDKNNTLETDEASKISVDSKRISQSVSVQKSTKSVQNAPKSRVTSAPLPQWVSNAIIAAMLILALATSFWFATQYSKLLKKKRAQKFIQAFYAKYREQLRVNYLRFPLEHRKYSKLDDVWATSLCVLMVKFAIAQKDSQTLVGQQSRIVTKALKQNTKSARQSVFPFIEAIQNRLFHDIQAVESHYTDARENSAKASSIRLNQQRVHTAKENSRLQGVTHIKPTAKTMRPKGDNIVDMTQVLTLKNSDIAPKSLWPDPV